MERTNRVGLKYELIDVSPVKTMIKHGDKNIIVDHPIDRINQGWYDWTMKGQMVQMAFHFLNADEREFIMTGMTTAEWTEMFSNKGDK